MKTVPKPKFTQIGKDIYHGETFVGRVNSRGQADLNPAGLNLLMKPEAKYELGWREAKTGNHQGLVIDEATGKSIAVTYDKAHARLIAAAPTLLQCLINLVKMIEDGDVTTVELDEARTAILLTKE